jgi:hypothetical protein
MSQELTAYDAVIADLEARRDQLTSMIETLKQMKVLGAPLPPTVGAGGVVRSQIDTDIAHDAFFQMPIPDAVKKYLGMVKQTKPLGVLCDALLAGGLKTAATNFKETVRSIINRNAEFVNVNGQWGLAEWYPQMRREKKTRGRGGSSAQASEASEPGGKKETTSLAILKTA